MNKIAFSADLHFGKKNNSEYHNQKLIEFLRQKMEYCHQFGIDEMVIAGDYFDNRQKIDVKTLHYGIQAIKMLSEEFRGNVRVLIGNHDLYHRDRLDVASTDVVEPYCHLYKEETIEEIKGHKIQFVPWVCDSEHWDRIVNQSKDAEYCFGHFEFNGFRANSHYVMEHGQSPKSLGHLGRVITGHFHHRQIKDNIVYVGSPFPFDFGDSDDAERGFGVLDLDKNEIEFVNSDLTTIITANYQDVLSGKYDQQLDDNDTEIRVTFDEEVDDDTLDQVKSRLEESSVRQSKIEYKPQKIKDYIESDVQLEQVEDIDDMVIHYIEQTKEIEGFDKNLMIEQYKEAMQYDSV